MKVNRFISGFFLNLLLCLAGLGFTQEVTGTVKEQCPAQYANLLHKKTIDYFGYRLKSQVERWGCEVVPVYTAFGNEHCVTLEVAEENPEMMKRLIEIMERTPDLPAVLHKYPRLTQALDLRLQNEEMGDEFWQILTSIGEKQALAYLQDEPLAAAITFLVPNTSPAYLVKNFSTQQQALLLELLNSAALTSSITQIEGMEELMPFITSNPADALQVYKKVLTTWGNSALIKLLHKSPQAVSSMIPPLTLDEMANLTPVSASPAAFHKMQEDYITLMRDLYANAANQHGPAWAAEYCMAFADILPMALLGAHSEEYNQIRRFLLDLLHGDFFAQILKPSNCQEETNVALLGQLLRRRPFVSRG